ncbi:MAG: homocysteine S-methyltransferase family protein [Candidatus Marinimicrobia bacterium]|nr:homocysteine S-methyltransferase family protein [Candidatus Neomarinimicrobiota bacterium]
MNLAEFISTQSPILLDGAMGTQLDAAGLEMGGQNCIHHPDAVLAVHNRYAELGCDLLITNTLTMNRISIESHKLDINVRDVNHAGAKLAKAAAKPGQYALGDISSTGQLLEPYGDYSEESFIETFKEQAEFLQAGGVDGFIIETIMDLREAICAVKGCRSVSDLPVLVTLSFQTVENEGRTLMGNTARDTALALADVGATAVGTNCGGLDPYETAKIIEMMREVVDLPLIAQPNAGKPRLVGTETVFDMSPEEFARGISACIDAGASLIGGCCGTSPAHMDAVAKMLGKG